MPGFLGVARGSYSDNGELFDEYAQDSITARAGGGQTNATQLVAQMNRVTTVATAADSVKLMASTPGREITIINKGANSLQVFGSGTDTIDDVATATGVSQMPNSTVLYFCTAAGKWYTEGLGTGYAGSLQTFSFADALTAHAGGGQGSATAITTTIARFNTVATAADSAVLPAAAAGLNITVINNGANTMAVFPATGDAINSLAANTSFSVAPGGVAEFFSTVAGFWHSVYTSATSQLPLLQRTSIATGNGTLTGAQVAGAQIVTLLTSGATALTTPTAANMLAAMGASGAVGQQWRLRIVNTNAGTLTITADASVTNSGTLTLATNTWREWDMTIVTSTTATMSNVGTGTTS